MRRQLGPERVLVFLYAVFVVAAGARSVVQLATRAGRAPLPYGLSAFAAGIYLVGLVLVRRAASGTGLGAARRFAVLELAAVIGVGAWSVLRPSAFPEPTVWSWFGVGYLFLPVAIPVGVLLWLRRRP